MRKRLKWWLPLALVMAVVAVTAACGGDDATEPAAPAETPAEEPAAPAEEPAEPPAEEPAAPAEPPAEEPAAPAEPPAEEPAAPAEPPAEEPAAPAEPPAEAAVCPAEDGTIDVFAAADVESAALGQNISPAAFNRMSTLFIDKVNAEGGIAGCQVKFTVQEDGFDIDTCLRLYREALQSGGYDVFFGPTNSGCMAGLPDLTQAAGKFLISGVAADHQPFFSDCSQAACFKEPYYVAHASVSTFLEGRTVALFAQDQGWQAPASMVPNYAYGQDVGNAFRQFYEAIVPGQKIVDEQFPEFDEAEFTTFFNAMLAKEPDGILTAFFSSFILPMMQQWKASGNDATIPVVSGLFSLDAQAGVTSADQIPQNWYGYDRGNQKLLESNPVAKTYIDLWAAAYGAEYPVIDSFAFQVLSSWTMLKGLVEQSGSLAPDDWVALIESGEFGYEGPYNEGMTYVNPINHMSDTCASVGQIAFDDALGQAAYDPATFFVSCMRTALPIAEAKEITRNPNVTEEAIAKYQELSGNA